MSANYRRAVSRNYSGRSDGNDEIDAALDDLGNFSYLDGIPFELDRGIQSALETARVHMKKAEALLATPLPSSLNQSTKDDSLLDDIGRVERQVLEQLKQIEAEREERKRKKDAMIKEYEEKKKEKQRIKAQKLLEEQELKSYSETNSNKDKDDNIPDKSCDKINENQCDAEAGPSVAESENVRNTSNHEVETSELKSEDNKMEQDSTISSTKEKSSPEETISASSQPEAFSSTSSNQFNEINHKESISSFPVSSSYLEPSRSNTSQLIPGNQRKSIPTQGLINFSEFENEPDPFEKAELQTLNDMQELASVFPQSNNINTNVSSAASSTPNSSLGQGQQQYVQSKEIIMSSTSCKLPPANPAAINTFQYPQFPQPPANPSAQFNPYLQTSQSNSISHPNSVGSFYTQGINVQSSVMASSSSNRQPFSPNNMYNQEITTPYIPPYQAPNSNDAKHITSESEPSAAAETLKTSKSVGDLMSEIQKETETMMLETKTNNVKRNTKESVINKSRAFSQTPPPSKNVCTGNVNQSQLKPNARLSHGRQSALEDWIPWPDIDGLPSTSQNKEASEKSQPTINPLEGLSTESSAKCKQLHDMGFPLERLGKACRAIGNDEQKLINYCLFVDKILEGSSALVKNLGDNCSSVVEDVVLIHSSDESKIRKHLEAFGRLLEFGFEPPSKIHTALTECDLNYEKALEQMLK